MTTRHFTAHHHGTDKRIVLRANPHERGEYAVTTIEPQICSSIESELSKPMKLHEYRVLSDLYIVFAEEAPCGLFLTCVLVPNENGGFRVKDAWQDFDKTNARHRFQRLYEERLEI